MLGLPSRTGALGGEPQIEFLSWAPRSYLYHNFLTEEECDHIVGLVRSCGRRPAGAETRLPLTRVWPGERGRLRRCTGQAARRSRPPCSAPAKRAMTPSQPPLQARPALEPSSVVDSNNGGSMKSECAAQTAPLPLPPPNLPPRISVPHSPQLPPDTDTGAQHPHLQGHVPLPRAERGGQQRRAAHRRLQHGPRRRARLAPAARPSAPACAPGWAPRLSVSGAKGREGALLVGVWRVPLTCPSRLPPLPAAVSAADHGEGIQVLKYEKTQKYEVRAPVLPHPLPAAPSPLSRRAARRAPLNTHNAAHNRATARPHNGRRTLTISTTRSTPRLAGSASPRSCCTCADKTPMIDVSPDALLLPRAWPRRVRLGR